MKMLVLFVVFFAAAVNSELVLPNEPDQPDPPPTRILTLRANSCAQYGIDYHGYDIQVVSNCNHWSDCARRCRYHQSCSYWTWNIGNKNCILKYSKAGQKLVRFAISGSQHCLSECWLLQMINQDIEVFYANSINNFLELNEINYKMHFEFYHTRNQDLNH